MRRIKSRMTGSIPLWTLTLKRDERSSRPHFSSSNWAAIIRERFSYPFTPAVPLLHLSSIALSLILGEVDERFCRFKSLPLMLAMLPPLLFRGQQETHRAASTLSVSEQQARKASFFTLFTMFHTNWMTFPFVLSNIFQKMNLNFIQYSSVFVYLLNICYMQNKYWMGIKID